jgi:hypothetical protein
MQTNLLEQVRTACMTVAGQARHVQINHEALPACLTWADEWWWTTGVGPYCGGVSR